MGKVFERIDIKVSKTEWGIVREYKEDGMYRFVLYKYDDDVLVEYLSNVYVEENYRRNGLGNGILKLAEEEAISHGSKYLMLRVIKNSWTHDWYKRHGFMNFQVDEDNQEYMWMEKYLG